MKSLRCSRIWRNCARFIPAIPPIWTRLETLIQSTEELRTQFGNAVTEERWDNAADILMNDYADALSQASVLLQEVDSSASTTATDFYNTSRADVQKFTYFAVGLSAVALVLTVLLGSASDPPAG